MIKFLILCIQDFKLAIFFKHLYLNIYWFLRWQLYWKIESIPIRLGKMSFGKWIVFFKQSR